MVNAEWVKSEGINVDDLDANVSREYSDRVKSLYEIYVIDPRYRDDKRTIGSIKTEYGCGFSHALRRWLVSDKRYEYLGKSDITSTASDDKPKVNVLVMDSSRSTLNPYPKELLDDVQKLVEADGKSILEVWTLTGVMRKHDWSKPFSEFPIHFDYFIFQDNWGGEDTYYGINRKDVADILYLANRPWKYTWYKAGEHHLIHTCDPNKDFHVKINALEKEICELKEKLDEKERED